LKPYTGNKTEKKKSKPDAVGHGRQVTHPCSSPNKRRENTVYDVEMPDAAMSGASGASLGKG
jgi:hypothetical protein